MKLAKKLNTLLTKLDQFCFHFTFLYLFNYSLVKRKFDLHLLLESHKVTIVYNYQATTIINLQATDAHTYTKKKSILIF